MSAEQGDLDPKVDPAIFALLSECYTSLGLGFRDLQANKEYKCF